MAVWIFAWHCGFVRGSVDLCMDCGFVYELWICAGIVDLCMNCGVVHGLCICVWHCGNPGVAGIACQAPDLLYT